MGVEMQYRNIAFQIMNLVKDHEGQVYIGSQPGCIDGLVKYLSSSDEKTLVFATRAIELLSNNDQVCGTLCDHPNILTYVIDLKDHECSNLQKIVGKILENMNKYINREKGLKKVEEPEVVESNNQVRAVVISLPVLKNKEDTKTFERKLIQVQGVYSVTLMPDKNIAVVYGKNDAALKDRLAKAMEDLDDMQKAVGDEVNPRPVFPRYMQNQEDLFPTGKSHLERFGAQTLAQRREEKLKQQRQARQRRSTMTRYLGLFGKGVGKGLTSCGLW